MCGKAERSEGLEQMKNSAEKKAEKFGLNSLASLAVRDNEDDVRWPAKEIELPFPRRAWGNVENWDRFAVTCINGIHINRKTGRPVQIDPRDLMAFLVIPDHETNEKVDTAFEALKNPKISQILEALQQHLQVAYKGPFFWPAQAHLSVTIQEKDLVPCQTFLEDPAYEPYQQGLHSAILQSIQEDRMDIYIAQEDPSQGGYFRGRKTFFPNLQRLVEEFRRAAVSAERSPGYYTPETSRRKIIHGLTGNIDERCGTREINGAFLLNLPQKSSNERERIIFIPGICVFAAYAVLLTALVDGTLLKHWEWFGLRIPETAFGPSEQLPKWEQASESEPEAEPKAIGKIGDALPELAKIAVTAEANEEDPPTQKRAG